MTYVYPELAEVSDEQKSRAVDTRMEDALPAELYPHCYCPQNELSYKILFDMLDEIIEVFEPREYVHMGHDEVYQIGICPKCKDKDPAELFANDVNRIYDHLRSKGLKMMIWSDMLQPVTRYKTPPARDMIPKDILMLDFIWYFHLDKDIEDNLLSSGFKVAFGNLYSSHFPRYESRIVKDGIVGGQISAWVPTNERELQKEGKLYDFFMTAQMLWSDSYSHFYTLTYDRIISDLMPRVREGLKGVRYPSLSEGAQRESLGSAPNGVNKLFDSLIFVHSSAYKMARMPWQDQDVLGRYVITYADGDRDIISIRNGGNIGYFGCRQNQPYKHPLYRHNGYTASYECDSETAFCGDGKIYTKYYLEHILKQKEISSVTLEVSSDYPDSVILTDIIGIKKK
jgi:hexosaminidase